MKKLTIRISDELHDRLVAFAQADHRSVNKQVITIIEGAMRGEKSQKLPQDPKGQNKGKPV